MITGGWTYAAERSSLDDDIASLKWRVRQLRATRLTAESHLEATGAQAQPAGVTVVDIGSEPVPVGYEP